MVGAKRFGEIDAGRKARDSCKRRRQGEERSSKLRPILRSCDYAKLYAKEFQRPRTKAEVAPDSIAIQLYRSPRPVETVPPAFTGHVGSLPRCDRFSPTSGENRTAGECRRMERYFSRRDTGSQRVITLSETEALSRKVIPTGRHATFPVFPVKQTELHRTHLASVIGATCRGYFSFVANALNGMPRMHVRRGKCSESLFIDWPRA